MAAPILSRSSVLSEEDLVTIVHETGQAHIQAIAKRETVSERLSHAIVEKGDDDTVATLIRNDGAQLARSTYEQVARRAEDSEILQEPLVERADAPRDLLNDLMVVVSRTLRDKISQRFDKLEPGVLEAALAASQARLEKRMAEDQAINEARRYIASKTGPQGTGRRVAGQPAARKKTRALRLGLRRADRGGLLHRQARAGA